MAYQAKIQIKTTGLSQLNKINASVDRINKSIISINKGGIKGKEVLVASKQNLATSRQQLTVDKQSNKQLTGILQKEKLVTKQLQQQAVSSEKIAKANRFRGKAGGTTGGKAGGGSGALQSGLISGAFPLLFGQGPLGAAAGFTGGFVGTKVGGQMGGFAGGLVATALLQTITNTVNGINELGSALNDPARNLSILTQNLSKFDRSISTSIDILQSAGLTQSAGQFGRARFGAEFGEGGASSIAEMNKAFKEFGRVTAKLGTELAILASGPLTGFMKMLNFVLGGGGTTGSSDQSLSETLTETIRKREKAIEEILDLENSIEAKLKERDIAKAVVFEPDKEKRRELSRSGDLGKAQSKFRRLGGEISEDKTNLERLKAEVKNFDDLVRLGKLQQRILKDTEIKLKDQLEIEKNRVNLTEKELINLEQNAKIKDLIFRIDKQKAEISAIEESGSKAELERAKQTLINLGLELDLVKQITENRLRAADPLLSRTDELNKEMQKLNDTQLQSVNLTKLMGSSFESSFKGIIKGTMSVEQAFGNMLDRMADHFLDMAAKMMANQFQQGLLGLIGKSIGGGFMDFVGKDDFTGAFSPGAKGPSPLLGFANGGRPPVGKPSMVGEKGPELFVPRSSGTIVPNNKLGGGGNNNVVVNVDASGSDVQGDDAGGQELGSLIAAAVQGELVKQQRPGGLLNR
nr:phage tape measure protein [uncultured Mediterranean phage uvMED]